MRMGRAVGCIDVRELKLGFLPRHSPLLHGLHAEADRSALLALHYREIVKDTLSMLRS